MIKNTIELTTMRTINQYFSFFYKNYNQAARNKMRKSQKKQTSNAACNCI